MSPAEIIEQATVEGVILTLPPRGTNKATGEQSAIDKWLPTIRDNKAAIITVLKVGADSTANTPMTSELDVLRDAYRGERDAPLH